MIKVASWSVYFSHKLIDRVSGGGMTVAQQGRLDNIVEIIRDMDPDVLGIIECMPADKLKYLAAMEQGTGVFLADVAPEEMVDRLRDARPNR